MTSLLNIAGNVPTDAFAEGSSLRFEDGDSAYLSFTPASAGNRKTWTWSGWVKRGNLGSNPTLFSAGTSTDLVVIRFDSDEITVYSECSASARIDTNAKLRDVSAWYHITVAFDTTQSTASDRIKIYVNGELQTVSVTAGTGYPSLNYDSAVNNTLEHTIGNWVYSKTSGNTLDGYLANVTFIDGTALTPTSFGEYEDTLWKPKSDTDIQALTFGTNGFYLPFAGDIDAGSSYYFDGNNDSVVYSSSSLYDVGSSDDFELECFFNTEMAVGSGDYGYVLGQYDGSSAFMTLAFDFRTANRKFEFYTGNGAAWAWQYTSGDVQANTWHHITVSRTSGTIRAFLDGTRLTSLSGNGAGTSSGGNVTGNTTSYNQSQFRLGESFAGEKEYKGYLSNVRFIVGSSLRTSDSSFTVPTSTLTDVTSTKLLTATNLTIGDDISSNNNDGTANNQARASGVNPFGAYSFFQDASGNDNHWTPNSLQYTDVVLDSPVTNFATHLSSDSTAVTISEGNLEIYYSPTNWRSIRSTFEVSSGKWYWEVRAGGSTHNAIGVAKNWVTSASSTQYVGITADSYGYLIGGQLYNNGSGSSYGATYTTGDIIGVALDMDSGTLEFFKNNVSQGTAATGLSGSFTPVNSVRSANSLTANFGQDSSFAGLETPQGNTDDNGQGDFQYAPPSGFLALTRNNLPAPSITAPDEYFNTVLYSGNGSSQSMTVGFQPDWVWTKGRNLVTTHGLFDSVRGATKRLRSDSTAAEDAVGLTSFDSNGFTTSNYNSSGYTYAAWNWKADTAFSNSAGTNGADLASTGRVNQEAGFSIVSFDLEATGSKTVLHGLSSAPEMIIIKARNTTVSTSNWFVYHSGIASDAETDYISLNLTNASADNNTVWNDTAPTSSVFTLGSGWTSGGYGTAQIAYCFHSVEGYSKIGSYTGNGSADGTFVHCGFRPAWVMVKRTDAVGSWWIHDAKRNTYNVVDNYLFANVGNAEASYDNLDILSNGFKLRLATYQPNTSGGSFIFLAFAEAPFRNANAR